MSEKYNGGPAFPHEAHGPNLSTWTEPGMTLRDYFAAKAMAAIISNPAFTPQESKYIPVTAYELADAMLEARE